MSDSTAVNRAASTVTVLSCLLVAGCAGRAQRPEPPQPASAAVPVAAAEQPPAVAPETPRAAVEAPQTAATPPPPPPVEPGRPAAPVAAPRAPAKPAVAAAPAVTPARPPAAVAAPPPAKVAPPVLKPAAPSVASTPSAPPLDLASLETRLRETKAIGVFTKISLKNQVDDLLNKFRAYYKRQANTTLAELRRPYDMLLMKVLSLLQDSDPPLAHDIVASREAIWSILADPQKFTESNLMAGETP